MKKDLSKCRDKIVCLNFPRYTRVSPDSARCAEARTGTPQGGGAPKFFLNWLTFAHSPYEPDHISGILGRAPSVLSRKVQVHGQAFSSASFLVREVYTVKMREGKAEKFIMKTKTKSNKKRCNKE